MTAAAALTLCAALAGALASCALHVAIKCDLDQRAERARCEREHDFLLIPPPYREVPASEASR